MTEYKVFYSPAAKEDLIAIYSYIANELSAVLAAKKHTDKIRNAIKSLSAMPCRHEEIKNTLWSGVNLRKMPVENFVIYYAVNEQELSVYVIRIFYGGRDIKNIAL